MSELTDDETQQLKDLIQRSTLSGIQFHELSARLTHLESGRPKATSEDAEVELSYQTRIGSSDFGVRTQVQVASESGEATAIVAADYTLDAGAPPAPETMELFASEVALMAPFPYLREGVSTATTRVFGHPVFLPMIQRGDVRATNSPPAD